MGSFSRRARRLAGSRVRETIHDRRDGALSTRCARLDAPPRTRRRALRNAGARTDGRIDRQASEQMDKQMDGQTDRRMDRQERERERKRRRESRMHRSERKTSFTATRSCVTRLVHTRATAGDAAETAASPIHAARNPSAFFPLSPFIAPESRVNHTRYRPSGCRKCRRCRSRGADPSLPLPAEELRLFFGALDPLRDAIPCIPLRPSVSSIVRSTILRRRS